MNLANFRQNNSMKKNCYVKQLFAIPHTRKFMIEFIELIRENYRDEKPRRLKKGFFVRKLTY